MTVASSGSAMLTLPTDEQILITREFDAPKHLVYKAWTTPELVKRWWNAKRGEVTLAEIDLRVGGKWRWVMIAGAAPALLALGIQLMVPESERWKAAVNERVARPLRNKMPVTSFVCLCRATMRRRRNSAWK